MSEAPDNSSRTILLILGIIAGVVVLMGLICGGLVYFGVKIVQNMVHDAEQARQTYEDAKGAANRFLDQLANNQVEPAYQSTSANFKTLRTKQQLDELVKPYRDLLRSRRLTDEGDKGGMSTRDSYEYRYLVGGQRRSVKFIVVVVKENNIWRVDRLDVDTEGGNADQ